MDSTVFFIPSQKFQGQKIGYVFKIGSRGLGYYLDPLQKKEKIKFDEEQESLKKRKIEEEKKYSEKEVEDLLLKLTNHIKQAKTLSKFCKCAPAALKIAKTNGILKSNDESSEKLWFNLLNIVFENRLKFKPEKLEKLPLKKDFENTRKFDFYINDYLELFEFCLSNQKAFLNDIHYQELTSMTTLLQCEKYLEIVDSFQFSKPFGKIRDQMEDFEKILNQTRLESEGSNLKDHLEKKISKKVLENFCESIQLCFDALHNNIFKNVNWHIPIIRSLLKFIWEKSQSNKILFSESQLKKFTDLNQKAINFKSNSFNSTKGENLNSFQEQEKRWKGEVIGMANTKKF